MVLNNKIDLRDVPPEPQPAAPSQPAQEVKVNASDDLASDWRVPTQEKTPGAPTTEPTGPASAQFDPNIAPEQEPQVQSTAPPSPDEEHALDLMADSGVSFLDWTVTTLSTVAMQYSLMDAQDRDTFRELLAEGAGKRKIQTEYEAYVLNAMAAVEKHRAEAPFSEPEKQVLKPALKPIVKKMLEAMQQKASPEWALAIALGQVSLPRFAPPAANLATKVFFQSKPPYSRATDVTNEPNEQP